MEHPDHIKIRVNASLLEANYFIQHAAIVQNLVYSITLLQQRIAELESHNFQLQSTLGRCSPTVPPEAQTPPEQAGADAVDLPSFGRYCPPFPSPQG